MFLYGWMDEREDPYAGMVIPPSTTTCINWELRMCDSVTQTHPHTQRRPGGHLGYLDHKAHERLQTWIRTVPKASGVPSQQSTEA